MRDNGRFGGDNKRGNRDSAPHRDAPRRDPPGRDSAGRDDSANMIFGVLPVLEALKADRRKIEKVVIADGSRESRLGEIVDLCRQRSISYSHVPREKFQASVNTGVNHQGIYAIISAAAYSPIEDVLGSDEPALVVVLDGVEDPRNLGAIIRAVECAGADGVIIPERRAVGLTETVAKSSAGALDHVKVAKVANINRVIEELKSKNIWVVGTTGDATMEYSDWDWKQPSALVMGNEGSGLHRLVAENCDVLVKIPMYGKIDSLNVSVATGVILFEARRQRAESKKP